MAAVLPIEDAGPRLAFRADDFLLVFVTAASSYIVAETLRGKTRIYKIFLSGGYYTFVNPVE